MWLTAMTGFFPAPRGVSDLLADGYAVKPLRYLTDAWHVFKSRPGILFTVAFTFTCLNEVISRVLPPPPTTRSLRVEVLYTLPFEMGRLAIFNGLEAVMTACLAFFVWQRLGGKPLSVVALCKEWRCLGRVLLCATLITGVAWTPIMFITSLPSVAGPLSVHVTWTGVILFSLIGSALFIYAMVSYAFAYLLLMARRVGIWTALEGSRRVVGRHWWRTGALVTLLLAFNLETYCLLGSIIQIVSHEWAFNWVCMSNMGGGQGTLILIVLTALGRTFAGCVLAVAYADIYGLPATLTEARPAHPFN
jgi:hypothetical protein